MSPQGSQIFLHGELRVAPYWAFLERGSTGEGRGETRKKGAKG